jgi:hypothetical protein
MEIIVMLERIRAFGARRTAIVVLGISLAGIVLAPTILAASAPPLTGTSPSADLPAKVGGLGRILRGEATVLKRDGSTATIRFERGAVTDLSASSIAVKGADGVSATFAIGSATVVRGGGKRLQLADLKVGDRVAVFSAGGTGPSTAALIRLLPAARGGAAKAGSQPAPTPTN